MSRIELGMNELLGKAYSRAVTPKKYVRLVESRRGDAAHEQVAKELSAALLPLLLPSPPSLLLGYLTELLTTPLLPPKTFFIHWLFYLSDHDLPSIDTILSISTILLSCPRGIDDGPLPAALVHPSIVTDVPDVGTSASAFNSPGRHTSTLALLLPLLRLCSTTPPSALSTLIAKAVAVLAPFPAPSLDVGLEAGQLLPSLPEDISAPLRSTLSGLMADLTSHDVQQGQGDIAMGEASMVSNGTAQSLPLRPALVFLFEHARRSDRWMEREVDLANPRPPQSLLDVLKIGPRLNDDPAVFLNMLVDVTVQGLLDHPVEDINAGETWNFMLEGVCGLIRWWKDHPDPHFPYPTEAASSVPAILHGLLPQMQVYSESISQRYTTLVQKSESEDESSSFTPLEGWHISSLQDTLASRLIGLGITSAEEVAAAMPGIQITASGSGESLLNRLAAESHQHLPPLVHLIQYANGAATSFADELMRIVKACPLIAPPENLFNYIASQPALLTALTGYISPGSLLETLVKHLIEAPVDESARNDDPQGSLTRFGEGVMLVEAMVAHFKLPMPRLLKEARRAVAFPHLEPSEKDCMNGWVKAIFGSDGIEDQILLATPPQSLYKLSPTLILQAIAATAAGQIDLDTLHSGLSYFSQPLLSWCLGGVVGWLCQEIRRQGLLSALHLVVLQDLILGHTCPEALLRVNVSALYDVLSPNSGLGPVVQSSGFDVDGVRTKLEASGLFNPPPSTITPLRAALQPARQLELALPGWQGALLDAVDQSVSLYGAVGVASVIMTEVTSPSTLSNDMLGGFVPLLLALSPGRAVEPLIWAVIRFWLPGLFGVQATPVQGESLSWLIKRTLLLVHESATAGRLQAVSDLVGGLVDELEDGLSRPVTGAEGSVKQKRRMNGLSPAQREMLDVMVRTLRDDEELRGRYECLRRLEGVL
ncbi:hypothetical protein IAU60_006191 [Kwoniella sp. DSM 27419]